MTTRIEAEGPFIIWLDYGRYEGWQPLRFRTLADLKAAVQNGETHGHPFVVTLEIPL